jgi:hypothetical protein
MKKNSLNILRLAALTLVFALLLSSCGANPKSLAKQTYDLYQEAIAATANPLKLPGVAIKAASLRRKLNNLSARDRQIYDEELERLTGVGLGGLLGLEGLGDLSGIEGLGGLLGGGGAGNSGGTDADTGGGESGGLMGLIRGLFGGGSSSSDSPSSGSSSTPATAGSGGGSEGGGILSGIAGWFRGLGSGGGARSGGKPAPLAANATLKQANDKVKAIIAYCDAHDTENNTAMKSLAGQIDFVLGLMVRSPTGTASWNEDKNGFIEGINSIIGELE